MFAVAMVIAAAGSLCARSMEAMTDSVTLPFGANHVIPGNYSDLMSDGYSAGLDVPRNIRTVPEYDMETGNYIIRTYVGDTEVGVPFMLSWQEYNNWQLRKSMSQYLRKRNSGDAAAEGRKPYDILDMNFDLGPLERIFGPGGVQLRTQGSVQLKMGINTSKTDNPALPLNSRRKTYFNFDQKIQANVGATVGDRMSFNMNYNTDAVFDFDSKNIYLHYDGTEDDIVKNIEAGNVSMTTGSSLIRGSTALFGIKSTLQFGRLTATALVSQQNSESCSVGTRGGVQSTDFTVRADEYDRNRHYFLGHYFRDNYDRFASRLPYVASGIQITRIEVWITNKRGSYDGARNIVAFMDLGEDSHLASSHWTADPSMPNPSNASNNLFETVKTEYPDARNINMVTQALAPLAAFGIEGGRDYEKVESARLLSPNDYTLNPTLGYISLNMELNSDEVLGVAYEYTLGGKVYQVGEFSGDVTTTDKALYVKMLKSTNVSPRLPMWHLMMKNVYDIGARNIEKNNFRLNIKYLSDTIGTEINYLPVAGLNSRPILQVMGLDRIDSNSQSNPDGFFDFIEGYTVDSRTGRVFFPVVEPFGRHLADKIGSPAVAEEYVYQQLYDSTQVVARQFADKNKYVLTGSYQASSGSQINLNAMNIPRGSVIVTAGGVRLNENSDYTVDYYSGIVNITNQSILDSGQPVNVTLENQSLFSMQRKTLLGLDLQYRVNRHLNIGGTLLHFSEKALTEKVGIGDEVINNSMWGLNLSYSNELMWLTNWLNKIPTVNASRPSTLNVTAEFAQLVPRQQKSGSTRGSSYVDDFESTQTGIDLRSPYAWFLASTPYDPSPGSLFPEAALSDNPDYGKNRALLNWYHIDRMFTQRNSSLCPGYLRADLKQQSNPYIREVTSREIFPDRQIPYGESNIIQTLNLSFYPSERGPYNVDAVNIDDEGRLLHPEKRWGGIMRRMDNPNFEQSNIEYVQFWLLNPFLDPENPNTEGGDLYFNFGEISEDILKDGMKSYENGIPYDGDDRYLKETVWGRVSTQNSLTYSFDNNNGSRRVQDTGLDGLLTDDEFKFGTYSNFVIDLRRRLSPAAVARMENDRFSPLNDPAGDNYHFFRGHDYDDERLGILERYKRYNGVEGNSLSPDDAGEPLYQSSRSVPDVEDINQDNTLNEYERYFQYHVSIRPEDLVVGRNYITDKQTSLVTTRSGEDLQVEWFQFKIPLADFEKIVGSINDFTSIRFARIFLTGFKEVTHLRFASLELVRGEWRTYDFSLNTRGDVPAEGELDVSTVNIEENSGREPVNYVIPPGVSRIVDPGQSQITQLNEQSMSLKVTGLAPGDARAVYKNTMLDLRNYRRLQMHIHAESLIDNQTDLRDGELSLFVRLGSDVRNNFYEYEIPLTLTPPGHYNGDLNSQRLEVWPESNYMDIPLQSLVSLKKARNREKSEEGSNVGYATLFTGRDPDNERNSMAVLGNPSLSDVRVMLIGIRNRAASVKDGTVWVNELRVTDFDESGGWAAKANVNLGLSDVATFNFGAHVETAGFGGVDQALNDRRMDDYHRYNFAMQIDAGRFLPSRAKLRAPIFYSVSREKTSPKYNPLDRDVLLKDALDDAATEQEKDSIRGYAEEHTTVKSFSISGLKFDVSSETPMPWDPANFTVNFSFNKQQHTDPTTEYENTNDYRGSLLYSYTPYARPFRPFSRMRSRNRNLRFLKEFELNYIPTSIQFLTTMSRYYYEQQTRSETDLMFRLPVSVSKNFLWDRQFALQWNLTRSLNLSFNSTTSARIEEPAGAVNKRLFPDEYKQWKDTVIRSILSMGTPWAYNQTFNASYRPPFSRIPVLDFISGSVSYNAVYRWDRGATVDGVSLGNTISNQATWSADARLNLDGLYNKIPYLRDINRRMTARGESQQRNPRRFERVFTLRKDTTVTVRHNMNTRKVRVRGVTTDGRHMPLRTRVTDGNSIEVLTRGDGNVKITVTEILSDDRTIFEKIGEYAARLAMSTRSASMRWRHSEGLTLPLFRNDVGNIFGQSNSYGPMSPGLDFAFGFSGVGYIGKALDRGWLITDDGQTTPAVWSQTSEVNLELNFEPIKGLRIQLTGNRTDNRNSRIQFMYPDIPHTRSGSYTRTHCAILTSLRTSSARDGYRSAAFSDMLAAIPVVAGRIERRYAGTTYPSTGFMKGNPLAGAPFDPSAGSVSTAGSDVLIPAFLAAYTGTDPGKVNLDPFPGLGSVLPNWRVTYDGLVNLWNLKNVFKSLTLSHVYQCTYSVGSYSSYLNWLSADGSDIGFILDDLTGRPVPSSPYNITSVAINERFAPLLGVKATLKNDISLSAEYRDSRTLTLNTGAGQVVEATQRGFTIGAGYKIVGFNTFLRLRGTHTGVSNDLTMKADISLLNSQALIRRIESNYTQATSGSRTLTMNFSANYVLSRRLTVGAFFDHQVNTPIVSASSYPTTNSSYGLTLSLSLAR